jgi:zinc transport system substrate-binding protein
MEKIMSRKLVSFATIAALVGSTGIADTPNVAVDIAPLHSLVSRVMAGIEGPKLIIQAGASPHEYQLRPSEAKALQDASLVFWMGEGLTPWMKNAVETLSKNAKKVPLLEVRETNLLEFRENALFEKHDHDDHDEKDDHDDHDDHDKKDDHDDHGHGAHDPHAWLSLENAKTWLNLIAAELSTADPENAGTYFANAASGRMEIDSLAIEINEILDPVRGKSFVVFHDAYQYFEKSFDFPSAGAISLSDASDPSPSRVAKIQGRVKNEKVTCVLAEPQFNPGIVDTVLSGTDAKTGIIDPLGSELELGPELYSHLMRNIAKTLAGCL